MSDARTLLRAKRQEARIQHPFAAYTSSGQLRCTACSSSIKSASMWEGHLGSKPHRLAVSRLREAEAAKAQAQAAALAEQEETRKRKRKAEDADIDMDVDDVPQDSLRVSENTKKRRTSEEPTTTTTSSSTSASASKPSKSGFPADFFSDPSQAPVLSTLDSEDESDSEAPHPSATTTTNNNTTQASSAPKSQLDLEWEAFQASLTASADREEDQKVAYERATVFAEPELAPSAINGGASGFPPNTGPGTFNNTEGTGQQGKQGQQEEAGKEEDEEETEEEKRARKEREERELIMDRLIEEERLQEEADERVGLLKARVEALKRAREAKRASKSTNNKS